MAIDFFEHEPFDFCRRNDRHAATIEVDAGSAPTVAARAAVADAAAAGLADVEPRPASLRRIDATEALNHAGEQIRGLSWTFRNRYERTPKHERTTWQALVKSLTRHLRVADKNAAELWSPARYAPHGTRGRDAVVDVSVLAFDVDDGTDPASISYWLGERHALAAHTAEWLSSSTGARRLAYKQELSAFFAFIA